MPKKKKPKKIWTKIWKKKIYIRQAHQGKKKAQYTENKNPRILKIRKEKKDQYKTEN